MGFRVRKMIVDAKEILRLRHEMHQNPQAGAMYGGGATKPARSDNVVPKGHLAVYVGENSNQKHRFVVPISYLNHPMFRQLLRRAEEEYGFDHPMGGLTIPCSTNTFLSVTSQLNDQCS